MYTHISSEKVAKGLQDKLQRRIHIPACLEELLNDPVPSETRIIKLP